MLKYLTSKLVITIVKNSLRYKCFIHVFSNSVIILRNVFEYQLSTVSPTSLIFNRIYDSKADTIVVANSLCGDSGRSVGLIGICIYSCSPGVV